MPIKFEDFPEIGYKKINVFDLYKATDNKIAVCLRHYEEYLNSNPFINNEDVDFYVNQSKQVYNDMKNTYIEVFFWNWSKNANKICNKIYDIYKNFDDSIIVAKCSTFVYRVCDAKDDDCTEYVKDEIGIKLNSVVIDQELSSNICKSLKNQFNISHDLVFNGFSLFDDFNYSNY